VPLPRAPQAVATLLQVASDRGISRARINLRPADLGGIEVQLSSTPAGVTARLVADSPDAARMLAQSGDELRRALASQDVNLLSLEVATSNPGGHEAHADRGTPHPSRPGGPAPLRATAEAAPSPEPSPATVVELPGGLLVDVLA
jgi:hypothetical protein